VILRYRPSSYSCRLMDESLRCVENWRLAMEEARLGERCSLLGGVCSLAAAGLFITNLSLPDPCSPVQNTT
jgi:hypothetical protein